MNRVIEISSNHRHLHAERGFLVIEDSQERNTLGRIPIDDIAAVIAHGYQITYSNELLSRLAERCIPLVLSNANHAPVGMLISLVGNVDQGRRFDAQIAATVPTNKRLWAQIVIAKISQQAILLEYLGYPSKRLWDMAGAVKSGDTGNLEAQAARIYWQRLFGSSFRRDREVPGLNTLLNYGYTILRAAAARAVVGAGLHPTIGIHHKSISNPLRLVDDMMEPFRPFIDHTVYALKDDYGGELTPEVKIELVEVLSHDLLTPAGVSPISSCLNVAATSLAQVYVGETESLRLPEAQISIDLQDLDED